MNLVTGDETHRLHVIFWRTFNSRLIVIGAVFFTFQDFVASDQFSVLFHWTGYCPVTLIKPSLCFFVRRLLPQTNLTSPSPTNRKNVAKYIQKYTKYTEKCKTYKIYVINERGNWNGYGPVKSYMITDNVAVL